MRERKFQGLRSKEDIEREAPRERETYAEDVIIEFLDRNLNGASITQIVSRKLHLLGIQLIVILKN